MMKTINTTLSLDGCWTMVNRIQLGRTSQEIRERCRIAEKWLRANKVISNDDFDKLMMTVALIHRETNHPEYSE